MDAEITSSVVRGLPRVPEEITFERVEVPVGDVLLMGTDGFADPLGKGTGELGRLFRTIFSEGAPPLLQFAHAMDFSRMTFDDDRTLVAIWPKAGSS